MAASKLVPPTEQEQAILSQLIEQARNIAPGTLVVYACRAAHPGEQGLIVGLTPPAPSHTEDLPDLALHDLCRQQGAVCGMPLCLSLAPKSQSLPALDLEFLPESLRQQEFAYQDIALQTPWWLLPLNLPRKRVVWLAAICGFACFVAWLMMPNSHDKSLDALQSYAAILRAHNHPGQARQVDAMIKQIEQLPQD